MNEASKVIDVALSEVGYLEKSSKYKGDIATLRNKTMGHGLDNVTKYWEDLSKSLQGQPWCNAFVNWCFVKAYGVENAKRLLCTSGNWSYYTPTSAQYFKNKKQWYSTNPKVGDIIYFKNSSRIYHVGIVYSVDSKNVYTIEGNTSSGKGVEANGGCVAKKAYAINNSKIAGYGRPTYGFSVSLTKKEDEKPKGSDIIIKCQRWLNEFNCNAIKEDGFYGNDTKEAIIKALQLILSEDQKKKVSITGSFDLKTKSNLPCNGFGDKSRLVKLIECYLFCVGYNPQNFNGSYNSDVETCVMEYQVDKGLSVDGEWGKQCWTNALK